MVAASTTGQRAPGGSSNALSISSPSDAGRSRKRVREFTHSTTDAVEPGLAHETKRARSSRIPHMPESNTELPIVAVPTEFLDANNPRVTRFSPGAIIALRLVDFQVSRDATYQFGPYLNMILGSNGTGKSTVVTAIFLLFQGRVRDLKQPSYGEFVTHGKTRAVVSAVIRAKMRAYHVVAMVINVARNPGGSSTQPQWYIDDKAVTSDEFSAFVASYHIQVNNLSQFLPQSRIASFAGLSPEDRLKSIEEAVGYDGMLNDHELLASRGQELVDTERDIELYSKRLEDLRQRQDELEIKVSQLATAQKEKGHLEYLNQVVKLAQYYAIQGELSELRDSLDNAREKLRNFDSEHRNIRSEAAKASEQLTRLGDASRNHEGTLREIATAFKDAQTRNRLAREELQRQIDMIDDAKRERDSFESKLEKADKEHRELRNKISRRLKRLNEKGDTESFAQQEEELNATELRSDELIQEERDLLQEKYAKEKVLDKVTFDLQHAGRQLSNLKDSKNEGRSLQDVQSVITWEKGKLKKAVEFVKQHSDKFKKPVINPAILSVEITDARLAPMITTVLPIGQLFKFVCQSREDMILLNTLAAEAQDDIDVKATLLTEEPKDITEYALKALKNAGFNGLLSDGVSGPKPVLNFINSLALNNTPYSFLPCSESSRKRLREACPQFRTFVDAQTRYSFSKSNYGRRLETEASTPVKLKPWGSLMLHRDTTIKEKSLTEKIRKLNSDKARLNSELETIEENLKLVTRESTEIRPKLVELKTAVNTVREVRKWQEDEKVLNQKVRDLKLKCAQQVSQSPRLIQNLIAAISEVSKNKVSLEHLGQLLRDSHNAAVLNTRKQDLENERSFLLSALEAKRESCVTQVNEFESKLHARQQATETQHIQAEEAISWLRTRSKLEKGDKLARNQPLAELQAEIGRRQSVLDMQDAQGESLTVLKEKLNIVLLEVQALTHKLEDANRRRENVRLEVASKREKWEAALTSIEETSSSSFMDMFKQLKCNGSVRIARPDPLAVGTWGLELYVAFRDNEEPQRLTRNRQSGGERSVTTAIYLMSLQRMARAPFRVLDEINQGMDKHNETKTMAFIVDHSCNGSQNDKAQQYFIITPKLLFNMPYHQRMSVNFIISSDGIERPQGLPSPLITEEELFGLIKEETLSDE